MYYMASTVLSRLICRLPARTSLRSIFGCLVGLALTTSFTLDPLVTKWWNLVYEAF